VRLDRCARWLFLVGIVAVTLAVPVTRASGRSPSPARPRFPPVASIQWPEGTEVVPIESVEGVLLLKATVSGPGRVPSSVGAAPGATPGESPARDSTGWFAIDTGAGFLALDSRFALALGILDSLPRQTVDIAPQPVPRLAIGSLAMDQIAPALVFDAKLLSRVTDRDVLGLIGYRVLRSAIVWLDFVAGRLALIPGGSESDLEDAPAIAESRRLVRGALSSAAIPARFRMTGDGKILIRVRVTPAGGGRPTPWLNLMLDTGASKTTLFEDVVEPLAKTSTWRPALRGLVAPTLYATSSARLCRVARVEIRGGAGTAEATNVDVALIQNPLSNELGRLAGEPVHGLIGYSFLERFRVAFDYPRRVLWLDPIPGFRTTRPYEHVHVGLQLERESGRVLVVAVAEGSPAAEAGVAIGDELVAVDSQPVAHLGWVELTRRLEGAPGTPITLTLRRGDLERSYDLRRRRLL
jgi:PDZ domain-containing protein/aspartyl protease